MYKQLLPFITVAALWGACCACESDYNTPSFSCNGYTMLLSLQDSSTSNLKISNNTFFRTPSDTGGYKYITLEAATDSFKIIFNLKDWPYDGSALWDDSLRLKTYTYSKHSGSTVSGLVVAGIKTGDSFKYLDTDTSSITLTRWNIYNQTMGGSYYFEASGHTFTGKGTFTKVCFISLK